MPEISVHLLGDLNLEPPGSYDSEDPKGLSKHRKFERVNEMLFSGLSNFKELEAESPARVGFGARGETIMSKLDRWLIRAPAADIGDMDLDFKNMKPQWLGNEGLSDHTPMSNP